MDSTQTQQSSKRQYNLAIMSTRSNEAWLSDLRDNGLARELALEDLRAIIQKGLPFAPAGFPRPAHQRFQSKR
jgi:type IV secretory pathway ATPase VirB11/archaellum biosynthesis ATPase